MPWQVGNSGMVGRKVSNIFQEHQVSSTNSLVTRICLNQQMSIFETTAYHRDLSMTNIYLEVIVPAMSVWINVFMPK